MTPTAVPRVFLSFSTADAIQAHEIRHALQANGIQCFVASLDIAVGANFANEIVRAIVGSAALVLLISESSLRSPHVRREVNLAIDEKCPLIPFLLSGSFQAVPDEWRYWLSAVQTVPFEGAAASARTVASSLERLRNDLVTVSIRPPQTLLESEERSVAQLDSGLTIGRISLRSDAPPSALLRAQAAATEIFGRDEELIRLDAWMGRDEYLLTRLVVGYGGVGKTRLALELCSRATANGWVAGFLAPDATLGEEIYKGGMPTLIVLDYAETRLQLIRQLIARLRKTSGAKMRILLLARSAGDWWTSLSLESPEFEALLTTSPPLILRPFGDDFEIVERIYKAAREAFCNHLGASEIDVRRRHQFVRDVTPLELQTLALIDVLEVRNRLDPEQEQSPTERLLNHERRYLKAAVSAECIDDIEIATMDQILAAMALVGAATEKAALADLRRLDLSLSDDVQKKVVRLLRRLYPGQGCYLSGIKPDLIAEDLVSQVVAGSGCVSENLGFPSEMLRGVPSEQLEPALTVLSRSAGRPHVREALFGLLHGLSEDFAIAAVHVAPQLEEPSALVEALRRGIRSSRLGRHALERLLAQIPEETVSLANVAADVCTALISLTPVVAGDCQSKVEAARFLSNASNRMSDVGRTAEAVSTARAAVDLLRTVSQDDSAVIPLGATLSNLSNRLWEVGDTESSLGMALEAVALLDGQGGESPDPVRLRKLSAGANNNLAFRWADLGNFEVSLPLAREAVTLFFDLHDTHDFFVRSGTASALNNLACIYNGLGLFDQAVKVADDAVGRRRNQVIENRDRFLPFLARALTNASIAHLGIEQGLGGLELGEKALDLQIMLSEQRPVFAWELGTSGLNLAAIHISRGKNNDALAVVDLVLDKAYRHPGLRLPDTRVTHMLQGLRNALITGRRLARSPLRSLEGPHGEIGTFLPFGLALEYKDL